MGKRMGILSVIALTALPLLVLLLLLAKPLALVGFIHAGTWKQSAVFEGYEEEFVLVKNYVAAYMDGTTGTLSVSNASSHKYDLFDLRTDSYLNCPAEIRTAIETLCKEAFRDKDTSFDYVTVTEDEIAFRTERGPYKLSFSPHKKPVMEHYTAEETLTRDLGAGWYHVVGRR